MPNRFDGRKTRARRRWQPVELEPCYVCGCFGFVFDIVFFSDQLYVGFCCLFGPASFGVLLFCWTRQFHAPSSVLLATGIPGMLWQLMALNHCPAQRIVITESPIRTASVPCA